MKINETKINRNAFTLPMNLLFIDNLETVLEWCKL